MDKRFLPGPHMRFALIIAGLLLPLAMLWSQVDYSWWNQKHNWDGHSHWTRYLNLAPAHLGPNALPVPEMFAASVPALHTLSMGAEAHLSKGDQTGNLYLDYVFPLFSDRASIQLTYRPLEIYRTDSVTRDLRASREYDPRGASLGDVYVTTHLQLVKDHSDLPDVMVSAGIKTASGTNLEGARNTDTPGYWFDLTAGKTLGATHRSSLLEWRIYGKIGFYAYQTYLKDNPQNDALIYGLGLDATGKRFTLSNQVAGYAGYFNTGDRPLVYRLAIQSNDERSASMGILFQQGILDFPFTSLQLTLKVNLTPTAKE